MWKKSEDGLVHEVDPSGTRTGKYYNPIVKVGGRLPIWSEGSDNIVGYLAREPDELKGSDDATGRLITRFFER